MNAHRSLPAFYMVTGSAALAGLLVSGTAHADRVYVVEESPNPPEVYEGRSQLDLAFDGEAAVPLMDRRFQSGNDLTGGGGFKFRVGDQIRFPGLRITPEGGYGFDHLFATDNSTFSYAWDMHRVFGGVRIGFGHIVVPTLYAHVGYGWRNTADPTVSSSSGVAFDTGFALDFHVVRHFGFGGHVEYAAIDAQPFTPQWLALGVHADIAF